MQEADPIREIGGTHGGHETAEVRGVRKTGGWCGLHRGAGRITVDGVSPDGPKSLRYGTTTSG